MKTFFKKIIYKVRAFLVTAYANRIYRHRVKDADRLHKEHKWRMYVCMPFGGTDLIVMDRKGFRKAKRLQHIYDPNVSTLKLGEGSFYYTGDRDENGQLSEKEKELRRLAFIHYMLIRAKIPKA